MTAISRPPRGARNTGSALTEVDVQRLKDAIKGTVVRKGEADQAEYEDAVGRWNGVSVREANFVVYVEDEDDVVACIKFVEKYHLDVAVAGGRHSYHGASSSEGLVIDLCRMRKVSLDKAAMTVTAQGGCVAGDVEGPCGREGLSAVFGAVNETGIGGLTLGGGVGWLTGCHGLAVDNLVSARVALANGEILSVSDKENADLFWAIRGGGPNFGIVTEFKYRVHKQGPVFMQRLIFTPDKLKACVSLVNKMHSISLQASDGKLQIMMGYSLTPGASALCPLYVVWYNGPEGEAKELAAPLYALEPAHAVGGMSNYAETTQLPPAMQVPGFERYAASSANMNYPLDETLLLNVFENFQRVVLKNMPHTRPSKCILDLRNYQKVASVPADATAYPGRFDNAWIIPDLQWDSSSLDAKMRVEVTAITAYIREQLQQKKVSAEVQDDGQTDVTAIYPNISAGGEEKAKSVFGPNLPKLQLLKKKYDPELMWNKWFPIMPA